MTVITVPISRKHQGRQMELATKMFDEITEWLGPQVAVEIAEAMLDRARKAAAADRKAS